MPEGNRRTPVDITLEFTEYSENNIDEYAVYSFYITCDKYLELPLDANVRLPTDKSIPYKEMVKTLETTPSRFFLQNNGMSVIAADVRINRSGKCVVLNFPPNTGIVNGGHTQLAILNTKASRDVSQAKVKIEVIKYNFNARELAEIAASRNTASNVKPYSTAEKMGLFLKIKQAMLQEFEKHIIWYENREVNGGVNAIDLIALIKLFDVTKFQSHFHNTSNEQPNKSATSKGSVFKEWIDNPDSLNHVFPLVNDLINLEEHINSTFDKKIPRGFTTLNVVKNLTKQDRKTVFTGKKIRFELPKQFLTLLIASLRADIKYDPTTNKIGWYEKPEDVFDRCKYSLITELQRTFKSTYHGVINSAGKDANLWRILYLNVTQKVDETKTWKLYDIS